MSATLNCVNCGNSFDAKRSDAKYCEPCKGPHKAQYLREYNHGKQRGSCIDCGADIGLRAKRCLPCENKARVERYVGHNNSNWREGRSHSGDGYVLVRTKTGSPGAGKGAFYRPEHHVVWERVHGKPLPKGWIVHHLNGIKSDNRPENLLGLPRHQHHQHPREALRPYEKRIRDLETEFQALQQLKLLE